EPVVTLVVTGKRLARYGGGTVRQRTDEGHVLVRRDDQLEQRRAITGVIRGRVTVRDRITEREDDARAGLARVVAAAAAAGATSRGRPACSAAVSSTGAAGVVGRRPAGRVAARAARTRVSPAASGGG